MKPLHVITIVIVALLFVQTAEAARRGTALRRSVEVVDAGAAAENEGRTPCEDTAKVAIKACRAEAYDDSYTQEGACLNLGDPEAAEECHEEAGETLAEDLEACKEQLDARLDLCDRLDEFRYDPDVGPDAFVSPGEIAANPNPHFPLVPGNRWVYENEEETITVTVTGETVEIAGVTCIEVRDVVVLTETGEAIEDTLDWYAQDVHGSVWYFGEVAKNFEDGRLVDLDGSWRAGADFAKPGILIPASPHPGLAYRQEFLLREAEDFAEVVSVTASESTPFAACSGTCLQTLEGTPIEPDVAEYKFYAPGIGLIVEVDVENGDRTELVSFSAP